MNDDDDVTIPLGMTDIRDAISVLHVMSHMIGNPRNRGGNDVLDKLRKLGFTDETSFYLLWYAFCVTYQEVEDLTNESFAIMSSVGVEIEEIFRLSEDFPALSETLRTIVFMDDDTKFGELKPSWKDHWKARYRKHWRQYLDTQDTSIPYYIDKDSDNAWNTD